jgi:hypothetical protein
VGGFRSEPNKVPKVVVRRLSLRNFCFWFRFAGVNNVGEFNGVLDKENGNIVSNKIPISFTSVKLEGETTDVTNSIRGSTRSQDGRKAKEEWGFIRRVVEDLRAGKFRDSLMKTKDAMCSCAACVDHTFWNAFMIEMVDLVSDGN